MLKIEDFLNKIENENLKFNDKVDIFHFLFNTNKKSSHWMRPLFLYSIMQMFKVLYHFSFIFQKKNKNTTCSSK